jgi:hypothetical protein
MIKFFRKIRQNLLSEGKTGKYYKYAIGEIFLVVIGILIALQINNWNEKRKLQNETNTYLNQKLENLNEDRLRLIELRDIRQDKTEKSKFVLDEGIQNVDLFSFTRILYLIVIERSFITTIERNESFITKYYSGNKEANINKLEQLYVYKIAEMKLEEDRLNIFSENAELILWINGFFVDNREIFTSIINDLNESEFKDELPRLSFSEDNVQKALEAILRRNELANPSLVVKLDSLIEINQKLIVEIQNYLN